jgi:uncharacterized protein YjbI with pentapeptide repeats
MSQALTALSGRELIDRIMAGERDFAATCIPGESCDLESEEAYAQLLSYLQEQDLRNSPIIAERSDWRGLKARGLCIQWAKLADADLSGADLRGADLRRSDFTGATFQGADLGEAELTHSRFIDADFSSATLRSADLYEANLTQSNLRNADLTGALLLRLSLERADMTGATLTRAQLYRVDLRGVVGLESVRDLARAQIHRAIVTRRERDIIENALRDLPLFDLRNE